MLTPKKNKFTSFIMGKGFYIMLAVCLTGAGIATWVSVDRSLNAIGTASGSQIELSWELSASSGEVGGEVSGIPKETSKPESSVSQYDPPESSESSPEESQALIPSQNVPIFTFPVSGEIITPFSNGELVKNETLNEWRTHNGIDIKAETGSEISASAAGTVNRIFSDPLWGNAIEILHKDGSLSRYYGLEPDISVTVGEQVRGGEVIAILGETNSAELALDSHLHFEILKDGKFVDPVKEISR